MKRVRTNKEQMEWMKNEYVIQLTSMEDIAQVLNITRQGVYKALKRMGIDTSKAQRVQRYCHTCGKPVLRYRHRARSTNKSYCNMDCYTAHLETLGEKYRPSAYHCRVARKIVSAHYTMQEGNVVHHVNKDDTDNQLKNLEVYNNQSDHLKKHRGMDVSPVWSGLYL